MKHFGLFPTLQAMANHFGVTLHNAAAFKRRREIPAKFDEETLSAATSSGFSVDYPDLLAWHQSHRYWRETGCPEGEEPSLPWLKFEGGEGEEQGLMTQAAE